MKKWNVTYWLVAALLTTACARELDLELAKEPSDTLAAVAFQAGMATPADGTRGANGRDIGGATAVGTGSLTLAGAGGFGVFASYTGLHRFADSNISSDFMYNEHVGWDAVNSVWTYEPVKYWPNGESTSTDVTAPRYVSFFAYAPYAAPGSDTPAGYCIPAFHLQQEVTNPWLTYRLHTDVAQQVDLLYATPLLDQTKTAVGSRLQLQFHHALACVGDQLTISCSTDMKEAVRELVTGGTTAAEVLLTEVSVSYTLTERGRLVLWTAGEANWQPIVSGEPTTERTVVLTPASPFLLYRYDGSSATAASWQDTGHGVFYIPIHTGRNVQTATVNVGYDVVETVGGAPSATHHTTSAVITLSDYAEGYQSGRHLYLNLTLSGGSDGGSGGGGGETPASVAVALGSATIASWTDGDTTSGTISPTMP